MLMHGDSNPSSAKSSLFQPQSLLVWGDWDSQNSAAYAVLHNLRMSQYGGAVYTIHYHKRQLMGYPTFATVEDIPREVDLALIAVQASAVAAAVEQCLRHGVKSILVLSSFDLRDDEEAYRALKDEIRSLVRRSSSRLVGLASAGIFRGHPGPLTLGSMDLSVRPGPVGIVSQSNTVGQNMAEELDTLGVGLSALICTGNQLDLGVSDYLTMLEEDPHTSVIGLFLQNAKAGRELLECCDRISRKKPIVLLKGSLLEPFPARFTPRLCRQSPDEVFQTSTQNVGCLLVRDVAEACRLLAFLSQAPLSQGPRTGILSSTSGCASLVMEACHREELEVPEASFTLGETLKAFLPGQVRGNNPFVLGEHYQPRQVQTALREMMQSGDFDQVACCLWEGLPQGDEAFIQAVQDGDSLLSSLYSLSRKYPCPLSVIHPLAEVPARQYRRLVDKPAVYPFSSAAQASSAFKHLGRHSKRVREGEGRPVFPELSPLDSFTREQIIALLDRAEKRPNGALSEAESKQVLRLVGLPLPQSVEVETPKEAAEAATALGFPVALKVSNPKLLSKSDTGKIALDLMDANSVRIQATAMQHHGMLLVEQMAPPPRAEVAVSVMTDPQFGPVVSLGKGGLDRTVWNDAALHVAPVEVAHARELIAKTKVNALLGDFIGYSPIDYGALASAVYLISSLPLWFPQLWEIDINPIFPYEDGLLVVDAKMFVLPRS